MAAKQETYFHKLWRMQAIRRNPDLLVTTEIAKDEPTNELDNSTSCDPLIEEEQMLCRFCFGGGECGPLVQPCECRGSIGYVHPPCLREWQRITVTTHCGICKAPYCPIFKLSWPKYKIIKKFLHLTWPKIASCVIVLLYVCFLFPLLLIVWTDIMMEEFRSHDGLGGIVFIIFTLAAYNGWAVICHEIFCEVPDMWNSLCIDYQHVQRH